MPTAGVTSASVLISGYFFFSAARTTSAFGESVPAKLKVWMKCTLEALGPASSLKRPPAGPQCDTIGTSQPMRSSDFTTWEEAPHSQPGRGRRHRPDADA